MSSLNQVNLIGRLGNDPEVRHFNNGSSVTTISIATSEKWVNDKGEKVERTEWHKVSLFGKLGEIASQYLRKGSQVYICGSIRTNKYTDSNGIERYGTEIRASEMRMLGSAKDSGGNNAPTTAPSRAATQTTAPAKPTKPAKAPITMPTSPTPPPAVAGDAQVEDDDIPF